MWTKTLIVLAISLALSITGVIAQHAADEEPIIRLRMQDQTPVPARQVALRPRFDAGVTAASQPVPMPKVSVQDPGPVGTFAFVSTGHPNLVLAVGSSEDRSELGRQIDRAIVNTGRRSGLYDHDRDRAPFIGVGLQTGTPASGWSMDATIGASLVYRAEQARVFGALDVQQAAALEAEAWANFKLRYRF
ncbi:MAG: hypothetical protein HRT80_09550 [Henriciella sp.]|nr:hypothetical protein [Henriciella sp.]